MLRECLECATEAEADRIVECLDFRIAWVAPRHCASIPGPHSSALAEPRCARRRLRGVAVRNVLSRQPIACVNTAASRCAFKPRNTAHVDGDAHRSELGSRWPASRSAVLAARAARLAPEFAKARPCEVRVAHGINHGRSACSSQRAAQTQHTLSPTASTDFHRATAASSPQRGRVLPSVACMRADRYFTTVTPIDLAVPMMDEQMDSRGMNSLPGSDCLTCARSASAREAGARKRTGAPLQSRTRASAKWSSSACVPVSGFPTGCLRRTHVQTRVPRGRASVATHPPPS